MTAATTIAAIDMGSNSFHLLIAEVEHSTWTRRYVAERKVQLAAGSGNGVLQDDAQSRALACLAEFKQIIELKGVQSLYIIATASLRGMTNAEPFRQQVRLLMGVLPEVVSGEQEADLVYRGVCGAVTNSAEARLVVDIGGGSTELAFGWGAQMRRGRSVAVGCLSYLRYFPQGRLNQANFEAARAAARFEFDRAVADIALPECIAPVGCSGTLLAVEQVLIARSGKPVGIDRADLQGLAQDLMSFGRVDAVNFAGLPPDRQSIFASGLAIVLALFEALNIEDMKVSERGLREGIIERCIRSA